MNNQKVNERSKALREAMENFDKNGTDCKITSLCTMQEVCQDYLQVDGGLLGEEKKEYVICFGGGRTLSQESTGHNSCRHQIKLRLMKKCEGLENVIKDWNVKTIYDPECENLIDDKAESLSQAIKTYLSKE